jgi:hypothetical protein
MKVSYFLKTDFDPNYFIFINGNREQFSYFCINDKYAAGRNIEFLVSLYI